MRFSLSNVFLLVALAAVALGWWFDHRRLQNANATLNAEAAKLFSAVLMTGPQAYSASHFPSGKLPPNRTYNFSSPEDRAEYFKTHGHSHGVSGLWK